MPPTPAVSANARVLASLQKISGQLDTLIQAITDMHAAWATGLAELTADDPPLQPQWGTQKIATTGSAVILGDADLQVVVVQALHGNAGTVVIGNQSIGQTVGYELSTGQAVGVVVSNLNQLSVNGASGDGVSWLGT